PESRRRGRLLLVPPAQAAGGGPALPAKSVGTQGGSEADAWGRLGEAQLRKGQYAEAWGSLLEAELLREDWPDLQIWRGEALAGLGRGAEAVRSFSRALAMGASEERLRPLMAKAQVEAPAPGRGSALDSQRAELDRAVAASPSVDAYMRRGEFLQRYGVPM